MAKCKNCGDPTHFGNATAEREKLGWCPACFKHYLPPKSDGPNHPLVNCKQCGRDTRSAYGYCPRCSVPGSAMPFASREMTGRKAISPKSLGGVPTTNDPDPE